VTVLMALSDLDELKVELIAPKFGSNGAECGGLGGWVDPKGNG